MKPRLPAAVEKAIKEERRAQILALMDGRDRYTRPQEVADALGLNLIPASNLLKDMWKDNILDAVQRKNRTNTSNENHYRIKQKSMLSTPWRKSYKWHPKPFYYLWAP